MLLHYATLRAPRSLSSSIVAIRHFGSTSPVLARNVKVKSRRTRKKNQSKSIYDREKMTLSDAVDVLRAVEVGSPNSMCELTVKTAMPRGSAIPKGRFNLPREAKKKQKDRILVFAEGRAAEEARRAGADIVGGPELVDGVISGRHQATLFLCTPALIRPISPRLGRVLGPRGLMPSERRGTVLEDVGGFIRRLQGTSEWKGDKSGTIRMPIARMDFSIEDITRNIRYFLNIVKKATGNTRDADSKGDNKPTNSITKVILSSRQGPGIQISDL